MKHGKKYTDAVKSYDRSVQYDTAEAMDICVKTGKAKFDETVEAHIKLGVDGRHADQQVRGAIILPNGTGKTVRILAICKEENMDAAKEAGADFVGADGAEDSDRGLDGFRRPHHNTRYDGSCRSSR